MPNEPLSNAQLAYLGLEQQPFADGSPGDFLYTDPVLDMPVNVILDHLGGAQNLILLKGEAGSGKSTQMIRVLTQGQEDFDFCAFRARPSISFTAIDYTLRQHWRELLPDMESESLEQIICALANGGHRPVIAIDDAQHLDVDVLNELVRLRQHVLNYCEYHLGVLLAGGGEVEMRLTIIDEKLDVPESRMAVQVRTLTREQTAAYLRHRLQTAGLEDPDFIDDEAIRTIFSKSNGRPARINAAANTFLASISEQKAKPAGAGFSARDDEVPDEDVEENTATKDFMAELFKQRARLFGQDADAPKDKKAAAKPQDNAFDLHLDEEMADDAPPRAAKRSARQKRRRPVAGARRHTAWWKQRWFIPVVSAVAVLGLLFTVVSAMMSGRDTRTTPQPVLQPLALPQLNLPEQPAGAALPGEAARAPLYAPPRPTPAPVEAVPPGAAVAPVEPEIITRPQAPLAANDNPLFAPPRRETPPAQPVVPQPVAEPPAVAPQRPATPPAQPTPPPAQPPAARPTPPVPQPAQAVVSGKRLRDSAWIRNQNPNHFTVQILALGSEDGVRRFAQEQPLEGDVAWFRTRRGNADLHILIFGVYPTADAARSAITALPAEVRRSQPFIRNFSSVQESMAP